MKGSEFHVLLGEVKLSSESEARIQAGIQTLVNQELVGYTPNPDDSGTPHRNPFGTGGNPHIVIPPIKWPGYILMRINDIPSLSHAMQNVIDIQKFSQNGMMNRG
jgi:hypothetical protein